MFVMMNHYYVAGGREQEFLTSLETYASFLKKALGFKGFRLFRKLSAKDEDVFVVHMSWDAAKNSKDWLNSEIHTKNDPQNNAPAGLFLKKSFLEGFSLVS